MKLRMLVLMGLAAGSIGLAQTPAIPSFSNEPLSFVPTPMADSAASELMRLQEARMGGKTVASLIPSLAQARLFPRAAEQPLPIVEPNSVIRYAMPVVTPDPDLDYTMPIVKPDPTVDYKLHIIESGPAPSDENAK